ncbi:methionyl-tRNA formyltransferase [Ruminococcus sp. OA3]|uniref:methionyl-tRNA formyltransferase n=1 Tax=Ruminococcus sp. OA3 TaxID=2914164 RepID=UPI001F060D0E|nr:methionyl-tRNA formyltransferase [Ruminococcus sp. OA3]MCH1982904.1 methionyl-tRNA formyltransferase [Ruminococcus sp. OA3]
MKSVLIGAVGSSNVMLETMVKIGFPLNCVFSLDDTGLENVSGYYPIHETAQKYGIDYRKFRNINDEQNVRLIKSIEPDYIFVIGLSQLVKKDIITSAKIGVIGFHPAPLPKYRGRSANVWQMILGEKKSKVSMFFIDKGIDSGDILGQEEYTFEETDYQCDIGKKIKDAEKVLAERVLNQIMDGSLVAMKQDESKATYCLKRSPEDGRINWSESIQKIHLLIRAISKPYPGAFSNYDGRHKVIIWRAEMHKNEQYIGFPGQIAQIDSKHIDVVCNDGLLRITDWENTDDVKLLVGHKFW